MHGIPSTPVLGLSDPRASDPTLTGRKAAALARAAARGLPVLPGFVVTPGTPPEHPSVTAAWRELSNDGSTPLVVRSSSLAEDGSTSSMAGVFTSLLGVTGPEAFSDAIDRVRCSAKIPDLVGAAPMGVLVQPFLPADRGGVLFGADPVTGRRDRLVLAVVDGGPRKVVDGETSGGRAVLTRHGRIVESDTAVSKGLRRTLAKLAARLEDLFGGPQDIEWAVDASGHTWLLQSRPITTLVSPEKGVGPWLGPGPIAETFPDPLAPLEEDLWLPPLREGLREALLLTGAASRAAVNASPIVTSVGGRVAVDLDLLGVDRSRSFLRRFAPRTLFRRLRVAWRVGRLREALPDLARDLMARADADLAAVPPVTELDDPALVALLHRAQQGLIALHGHEALSGILAASSNATATGASVALRAVIEGRAEGLDDAAIVFRAPVVLALVPPSVGRSLELPPTPGRLPPPAVEVDEDALVREGLRLRARWLQELTARATAELGKRLARRGALADWTKVRVLRLDELESFATGLGVADHRSGVVEAGPLPADAGPLPARFRLGPSGALVVDPVGPGRRNGHGTGAGGGRGTGRVHDLDSGPPPDGVVLVVRTLDPGLAPLLPGLAGLVAEAGSVLSHLAILAREFGVPTVVGAAGAVERFRPGTAVVVDGTTGEVAVAPPPGRAVVA